VRGKEKRPLCLPICLPTFHLPACLSACASTCLSVCLPTSPSVCLPVHLSVFLSFCLSTCQFAYLPIYLSICLSACSSACLPACLPMFLAYPFHALEIKGNWWTHWVTKMLQSAFLFHRNLLTRDICIKKQHALIAFDFPDTVWVHCCHMCLYLFS
jgi:hypothetical protein